MASNPGRVRSLSSGLCIYSVYTVLQSVQRPRVCSAIYSPVNYKERLKLFDKSRT